MANAGIRAMFGSMISYKEWQARNAAGEFGYQFENPEAEAFVARMDVQPDNTRKELIDTFFTEIAHIVDKLDQLWMAGHDQQSSLLNWVGATDVTAVGTAAFTADRGFQGNGTDFYLNSNILSDGSGNAGQDNLTVGGGIQDTNGTTSKFRTLIGVLQDVSLATVWLRINASSSNGISIRCNTSATQPLTSSITNSMWGLTRSNSANYKRFKDTTDLGSVAAASVGNAAAARSFLYMALHDVGSAISFYSLHRQWCGFIGGYLTDSEYLDLIYAMNRYGAAIGAVTLYAQPLSELAVQMTPAQLSTGNNVLINLSAVGEYNALNATEVTIAQTGDLTDSAFDTDLTDAIAAAAATTPGASFDGMGRLTFTEDWDGNFSINRGQFIGAELDGEAYSIEISDSTILPILGPVTTAIVGEPVLPVSPAFLRAVNISGLEHGSNIPGTKITDYERPRDESFAWFAARGFSVRLPFKWERIQHDLYGGLDIVGDGSGDFEELQACVDYATNTLGQTIILDMHNYAGRYVSGLNYKIGTSTVPAAALVDVWVKIANVFKTNPLVEFDICNEPNGITSARWWKIQQAVVDAIRAAKALNRIHVEMVAYSRANIVANSFTEMEAFRDPVNNFVYHPHQYLDSGYEGNEPSCLAGVGSTALDAITAWAAAGTNRKWFLGEFAGGPPSENAQCGTEIPALVGHCEADVNCAGWAVWGGGERVSNNDPFKLMPPNIETDPDTELITLYMGYIP